MKSRASGFIILVVLIVIICSSFVKSEHNLLPATDIKSYANGLTEEGLSLIRAEAPREAIVVIDPGHGGIDDGATDFNLKEKDICLDISLKLGELLKKDGIKTDFTRDKDNYVGLQDRANKANKEHADLFISVHINKLPEYPEVKGTEVLFAPKQPYLNGMNSKRFADIVCSQIVDSLKTEDNGIKSRPELAVLHRTDMPAIIAEIGYISNSADRSNLSDPDFRENAAHSLATATEKALQMMGAKVNSDNKWMISSETDIKK
ncbi:MAG: N-acetylmuramoyl-L-alanine amidase [Bacillota bacterium]|nr:N-acetylmuramoyl-L-alanine amidase [Bacillota bacterium]